MHQVTVYVKVITIAALALISVGLMTACGSTSTQPPRPAADDAVEVARVPPPTPTKPASPTPTAAVIAPDDGCVGCHTNQERLITTAKEEVVVEALSEGEG